MKRRMAISRGGQISVPATVRHRWATRTVVIDDRGDHLIIRPAPDDPIAAAEGSLAAYGPVVIEDLRRMAREDDADAGARRRP
jgi:hypothetical protein